MEVNRPLGDYAVKLRFDPAEGIQGKVETLTQDALLKIRGDIRIGPDYRMLTFRGRGAAAPGAADSLHTLMTLLGEVEDDSFTMDWQTALK